MKKLFCNGIFIFYDKKNKMIKKFFGNMLVINGYISCFTSKLIKDTEIINLEKKIVIPAFSNMHLHLGDLTFRPVEKMSLLNYINYTEAMNLSFGENKQKHWESSAKKTLKECINTGTLVVNTIRGQNILNNFPIKSICGYPIMLSEKLRQFYDLGLSGYKKFSRECLKKGIIPLVFIHSLYMNNNNSILFAKKCISLQNSICAVHVGEDEETEKIVLEKWGKRSIQILDEHGLLNQKTILIHGCVSSDKELSLIKQRKSTVVVCPISNKNLLSQCINPNKLIKNKINWCIGSDGLATGESGDLLLQTKELLTYKISAKSILEALTINATKIFKINNEILSKNSLANFNIFESCSDRSIENILKQIFNQKLKHIAVYRNGECIEYNDN